MGQAANGFNEQKRFMSLVAEPKTPAQWFMRRIFLERKEADFKALRTQLRDAGVCRDFRGTFWPAARGYFDFESKAAEQKRCAELESRLFFNSLERVAMVEQAAKEKREQQDLEHTYDENVPYMEEVRWAFQNWPRFVKIRKSGSAELVDEGKLRSEAPSLGAVGLIEYARQSLDKFQALASRVLAKTVELSETANEDVVCDDGIDELKRVLQDVAQ